MVTNEPRFTAADIRHHCEWLYAVTLTVAESQSLYARLKKLAESGGGWATKNHRHEDKTAGGLSVWLKSRLSEMGLLNVTHADPDDFASGVPLHVFFLHIEETYYQLQLLRSSTEPKTPAIPVRSRINRYMQSHSVQPIDKTAFNVATPPEGNTHNE
jgi:hypothetical protein